MPERPGAEDDRRDHDMEAVEASRRQEPRYGIGAAFYEDAAQAALGQRRQDGGRFDPAACLRQRDDFDAGRHRRGGCRHDQPAHAVRSEQLGVGRQPAARVDHHPRWVGAGDVPNRELRIVRGRSADPDHHGIDQRPQPVQMGESGRAVDVVRMAGWRGDPAVQRLADLADHDQAVDLAGA